MEMFYFTWKLWFYRLWSELVEFTNTSLNSQFRVSWRLMIGGLWSGIFNFYEKLISSWYRQFPSHFFVFSWLLKYWRFLYWLVLLRIGIITCKMFFFFFKYFVKMHVKCKLDVHTCKMAKEYNSMTILKKLRINFKMNNLNLRHFYGRIMSRMV